MTSETVLRNKFVAATTDELRKASPARRIASIADQRVIFPHHGVIELHTGRLILGDWRTLVSAEIDSVTNEFTPGYGRFAAGGARGGFPSLGIFKRAGAPLVLDLISGEKLVLLVGFAPLSGVTKNQQWLAALKEFVDPPQRSPE